MSPRSGSSGEIISGNAQRVARYREKHARLDLSISADIAQTVAEISEALDCSKNELLNSMVRFALTNRNWRLVGLYGRRR
jgi:predicted ATPase